MALRLDCKSGDWQIFLTLGYPRGVFLAPSVFLCIFYLGILRVLISQLFFDKEIDSLTARKHINCVFKQIRKKNNMVISKQCHFAGNLYKDVSIKKFQSSHSLLSVTIIIFSLIHGNCLQSNF